MSRREREDKKQQLLSLITQQRVELDSCCLQWIVATSGYDHAWFKIVSLRRYLAVGGGVLALWTLRRPKKLLRFAKRGLGIWSSWRMVRKMIAKA